MDDAIKNNGKISSDFLTSPRWAKLRQKMRFAFLHPSNSQFKNDPARAYVGGEGDITKEQLGDINAQILNGIGLEFGALPKDTWIELSYSLSQNTGTSKKTFARLFDDWWRSEYQGSHNHETNTILCDIIGEMFGVSDTYLNNSEVAPDVDINGQPIYRSQEERDA